MTTYLPIFTVGNEYLSMNDSKTYDKLPSLNKNLSALYPTRVFCNMKDASMQQALMFILGSVMLTTVVVSGLTYIIIIIKMILRGVETNSHNFAVEAKLAAVFLINVLLLTGIMIFSSLGWEKGTIMSFYMFDLVYFFMDLYLLCNPYLLMIFSKSVRMAFYKFLRLNINAVQSINTLGH